MTSMLFWPMEFAALFNKILRSSLIRLAGAFCARALTRVACAACAACSFLSRLTGATPRLLASGGMFHFGAPSMPTRSAMSVSLRTPVTWLRSIQTAALLVCCASMAHAAGPTGLLNDTGQILCDDGSNTMVACTSANTGDSATYKRQDGRYGRDPAVGGGAAGFDFTRVCFNGNLQGTGTCTGSLVANTTGTATGTASTDWACTKDNVTNLIWSLQTQQATWTAATAGSYPNAGHNSVSRCGFNSGWRMPTRRELLGIMLFDGNSTTVNPSYFPNAIANYHWSSDAVAAAPSDAWMVVFFGYTQTITPRVKSDPLYVRLVRSGQ